MRAGIGTAIRQWGKALFERFFRRRAKKQVPVFGELRAKALEATPTSLGLGPTSVLPHVFGAIMETGYDPVVATLVVFADGSVSLYFSTGGGIIGAGQHQAVRNAADAFLESAESFHSQLQRTQQTPLPGPGRTRFYLRTFDGTLTAEAEERTLGEGASRAIQPFPCGARSNRQHPTNSRTRCPLRAPCNSRPAQGAGLKSQVGARPPPQKSLALAVCGTWSTASERE
ncbi:MAG: hypothetical protein L0Z55_02575 [Planctomycetes bacterium]|nr:hypothetical protein [Planctomycetota bacterium]